MGHQAIHNKPHFKQLRKGLRSSLTPAEATLWKGLQRSLLIGKTFRRQHSIGNYIVDFYCPECCLAIELDGQPHFNSVASEYDAQRTAFLNRLNIRVLRFENKAIFENFAAVLEMIKDHLTTPLPPPETGGEPRG